MPLLRRRSGRARAASALYHAHEQGGGADHASRNRRARIGVRPFVPTERRGSVANESATPWLSPSPTGVTPKGNQANHTEGRSQQHEEVCALWKGRVLNWVL